MKDSLLLDVAVEPLGVGQRLLARLALLGGCVVLCSICRRRFAVGAVLGVEMTRCHVALGWYSL